MTHQQQDHNAWQERIEQLTHLPVAELIQRPQTLSDEDALLALFLIAQSAEEPPLEHSIQARLWLFQRYAAQLLTWINQHPWSTLLHENERTALLHRVYVRILETLPVEPSMQGKVLQFMKMTVHAVIADEMRMVRLQQNIEASDDVAVTDLLQIEFCDEREAVLIYLAYVRGMKPSAISLRYSYLFPTTEDVLRLKRNILERLRAKGQLQERPPDWNKWEGG